ncbi:hypothetical protein L6255_01255 [Candidatus Parcubacteria bacterium]|nr:hypothetical protein [Patescibacteria group bacterium]MBU4381051.1 hypothetical protein [Patescibacteria group bacterium]MCG2689046.1 hypothetical protein [Candidatus Parcubacteria bacterium]
MEINDDKKQLLNLITESQKVALCVPEKLSTDTIAAASGLASLLTDRGKEVSVLYCGNEEIVKEFNQYAKIQKSFGEYSLTVSLDYNNTPIEKVSYKAEDGVFKLTVTPIEKDFDLSKIGYDFTGPAYDLFIILGAQKLTNLGEIYTNNEEAFKKSPLINFDNNSANERYGTTNIVENTAPNLVSLVLAKMATVGYFPSANAIKAFLLGLSQNNSLTEAPL